MKITILGNNGPFPDAGGACSGYLIETDHACILLDTGSGVLSNLQRHRKIHELDAVILTHMHSDHTSDMGVMRYAIQVMKNRGLFEGTIPVWAAAEPQEIYKTLEEPAYFALQPLTDGMHLMVGDVHLSFHAMPHAVPSFAVRAEADRTFFYSSDTGYCKELVEAMRGADLALLHAGLLEADRKPGKAVHLSARDCGLAAAEAGVGKLLLSHRYPGYTEEEMVKEARNCFSGAAFAGMNEVYTICNFELRELQK